MLKEVVVEQAEIEVDGKRFIVTRIPTATSGSWFVLQLKDDACEIWAAVAIDDLSGEVIGWRNPPTKFQAEIENGVRKAFDIQVQE